MHLKVTGSQSLLLLFSRILLLLGLIALLVSAYFPGFTMHQEMRSQTRAQRHAEADYGLHPWGYEKTQTTTVLNQTLGLEENNDTALAPVNSETSLDYRSSDLKWMTYLLTGFLIFSVFIAIALIVMEIRYDPKKPSRTKTTLALFYPLVFMVIAMALLFFFIVPQYFATEAGSAAAFRPHMPAPAIGAGDGPYPEAGKGSGFDVLFPPDETDAFDFKVSWAPGMALYLYFGSAILFMASFFFLRAHDKMSVGGVKGRAVAPEKGVARVVAAVDEGYEEEPVEATVSEIEGEDEAETVLAVVEEEDARSEEIQAKTPQRAMQPAPKSPAPAVVSKQAPQQRQTASPAVVKADELPSEQVISIPVPSREAPQITANPDTAAPDMLGLDMDTGGGSGFDLRMEDEVPPPAKVTIIEMGESDFGSERDLDIEGEVWLTLQCPQCGNTFKVSSHDRTVKCDRCGLESEIG